MKKLAIIALLISVMLIAGCASQIKCSEPNTVIGNECCLDDNDNDQCDNSEEELEPEPAEQVEKKVVRAVPEPEPEPEPQIRQVYTEPTPAIDLINPTEPGIYKMRQGESRKWVEINEIFAYRTSRDKGYMDYMIYTVRNHGTKKAKFKVNMMFEYGLNSMGADARVGKEYTIAQLEPGEKAIMKQSLGIYFKGIEELKTMEMNIYDPFVVPKEDLDTLTKTFTPTKYFPDMETHTYGYEE